MNLTKATILGITDVLKNNRSTISRYIVTHGLIKSNFPNKLKITKGSNFFIKRVIDNHMSDKINLRKFHVKKEVMNIIEEDYSPRIGTLVVQHHKASHDHFDISIIDKGKEIFRGAVSKRKLDKLFPKTTRSSTSFIRQPQHETDYTLKTPKKFTIPEGEYGAGTVERVLNIPVEIMKTDNNKVSFKVYEKGFEGHYSLQNREEYWQCIRKKDHVVKQFGRGKFRVITGEKDSNKITTDMRKKVDRFSKDGKVIFEEKYRGACNFLRFGKKENIIWSHRKSIEDKPIFHHNRYNEIRDEIYPDLDNTEVSGELLYVQGKISKLNNKYLQSNGLQLENIISRFSHIKDCINSRNIRKTENGNVGFVIWDIHKYKGKDVSKLSYKEKIDIIDSISSKSKVFYSPRRFDNLDIAWKKVVQEEKGEGLVVKRLDKTTPQPNKVGSGCWLKIKDKEFIDARIVGWKPTRKITGIIDDSMVGEFTVKDKSGKQFSCPATGATHFQRKWFRNNIEQILKDESIIKIKHEGITPKAVLKPVFVGVHGEKTQGVLNELLLEEYSSDNRINKYQLKGKYLKK